MQRTILERGFSPELVKSRAGPFGTVSYVEAVHYIRRLNEAFDGNWSWRIIGHEVRGDQVIVHGELQAEGHTRHAFGGSEVTVNKKTGEVAALADDFKAAATDALKKACSLLGIGLDLYGGGSEVEGSTGQQPVKTATQLRPVAAPAEVPNSDPMRLTAKQLKAIWAIATAKKISDADLKARAKAEFGCHPEFFTKRQASGFIELLTTGDAA